MPALLLLALVTGLFAAIPAGARTIMYQPDRSLFPNPERGWQETFNPAWDDTPAPPLQIDALRRLREDNVTVVDVFYLLKEFRHGPLSPQFLDRLESDFAACRGAGVKMVLRFAYIWRRDLGPEPGVNATFDVVLLHIDQLRPLLQQNADVILLLEAGFIGPWGEWHDEGRPGHLAGMSGDLLGGDWHIDVNDHSRAIMDALMAALPKERMICVRYVHQIQQLNNQPVSRDDPARTASFPPELAFRGSFRARLGRHNDGFHYDLEDDMGSWSDDPVVREAEKGYLDSLSQYTFSTGETTGSSGGARSVSPIPELERHHWDTLSRLPGALGEYRERWKRDGTYDTIGRRLGYRFRLVAASFPERVKAGDALALTLHLANDGFAAPKNPRRLELVLRSGDGRTTRRVDLTRSADPRSWFPGERTLALAAPLPADLARGRYDLLLNLPDPMPRLSARPEYSVRLANEGVWESGTGFNRLLHSIEVTPQSRSGDPPAVARKKDRVAELKERIGSTPFPRTGTTWHAVRGDNSDASLLRHDLVITGPHWYELQYEREAGDVPERFTADSMARARERIATIRKLYPHAVLIASIAFFEYSGLREGHPWYLRWEDAQHKQQWWYKREGGLVQFWPGTYRMDIANRDYQARVVGQIRQLKEAGLDGVFIDNLGMGGMALTKGVDERPAWTSFFRGIREACGDDFLIIANGGLLAPWAAPYLNGAMFEGFGYGPETDWDREIARMQEMAKAQPEPHIDYLERFERRGDDAGWPGDPERGLPPAARDPASRRWSLALALTIGDYYYLFSDSTHHAHDWYPEYDLKIGLPLGPGERVSSHVWHRRFEKALVVVNLPGARESYQVEVETRSVDSFSGERGTQFMVPPGDGRILIPLEALGS